MSQGMGSPSTQLQGCAGTERSSGVTNPTVLVTVQGGVAEKRRVQDFLHPGVQTLNHSMSVPGGRCFSVLQYPASSCDHNLRRAVAS